MRNGRIGTAMPQEVFDPAQLDNGFTRSRAAGDVIEELNFQSVK